MDESLEAEFKKLKCLFDRISSPLAVLGIWPKNMTLSSQVKSTIFLTYFTIHLILLLLDLVDVMGSLELVIWNLIESGFQSMVMYRILIIRFDKKMRRILDSIEEDFVIERFRDSEEIKIILEYSSIVEKFYRMGTPVAAVSGMMYYLTPLQTYIITRMMNDTAVLGLPYRTYHFIDISSIERTAIVYAYQFPIMYLVVIYVTCYGILLGFVTNLCGRLAILTHKISTMKEGDSDPHIVFQQHTQQHLKIVVMAQWLNDVFHLVLLCELGETSVLMGLLTYQFLTGVDNNNVNLFGAMGLLSCLLSAVILVYTNCFMGECLNTECTALLNAYYECNWYEMSPFYKKALIMCMKTTQEPIRLTAGKFYVFSLKGFSQIMKSSMVYVSMLRTLN